MVTEHAEVDSEGQMQLPDDDEEDLCRVWDMAMDKVELFHEQLTTTQYKKTNVSKCYFGLELCNKLNDLFGV